ncbi:anti-sigma-I factor RsgI family protein [Rossellomorea sp. BNER]|uniref:anti-sigma-I factor RsgI family protein n=1 Tax=Rossellomorea sp. BNER TaxID=2962031 RepID=UPI003AF1F1E0|nr:hypothetical protein [Rossellomorea sp. BNER]
MKKGIIFEVRDEYLILMTPDGYFLKGRKNTNKQYVVGEETSFFPITGKRKKRKGIKPYLLLPVIAVATLMLCFSMMLPLFQNDEVYAYVSVDINPSLELSINRDHEVIDIIPYNVDGKKILSQLKQWEGHSLTEVTSKIILKSKENGYLYDQKIMITSIFTEKINKKQKEAFDHLLNNFAKKNKYRKQISVHHSTEEVRKKAHENGVSIRAYINKKSKFMNKDHRNKTIKMKEESVKDKEKNISPDPEGKKENITKDKQIQENQPSQKNHENRDHSISKEHPQREEQKSNGKDMNHPKNKEKEENNNEHPQSNGREKSQNNNNGEKPNSQVNGNNGSGNKGNNKNKE